MKYSLSILIILLKIVAICPGVKAQSLREINAKLEPIQKSEMLDTIPASLILSLAEQSLPLLSVNSPIDTSWSKNLHLLIYLLYKKEEYAFIKQKLLPSHLLADGNFPPNSFHMGRTYYWLGHTYYNTHSPDSSINYFHKAVQLQHKFGDSTKLHKSYSTLSLLYKAQLNYQKAILYLEKSSKIKAKKDTAALPKDYNKLATIYLHLEDLAKAKVYLDSCISLAKDSTTLQHAYTNYGRFYEYKGLLENNPMFYEKAIEEHEKALNIRLEIGSEEELLNSYVNLGANHDYLGNYTEAIDFYKNAMELESRDTDPIIKIKIRENIADIYLKKNSFQYSIGYLKQLADSIEQNQLGLLDNRDKRLVIERLEKTIEKSQAKYLQLILILSFSLLAAILSSIIFWQISKRRKLQAENQEILDQHGKDLADERVKAQELILKKTAQEIHDNIQNFLWAWKLGTCEKEGKETHAKLNSLSEIVKDISHQFHPPLNQDGLDPSLRELCARLNKNKHLTIEFQSWQVISRRFFSSVETNIYRIVQEALNNVLKYSRAKEVSIQLIHHTDEREYLSLCIEDDGIGFNPDTKSQGIGLSSMRDRAESLNGSIFIDSSPGNGTSIFVDIPAEVKSLE